MGKSQPNYNPPAPPQLQSAQELFSQGTDYAKQNMPLAYGARESGLQDLSRGNDYYNQFQPTSFEQALGNQYFQNVWPDQEQYMSNLMSLKGFGDSPVTAATLGKARGDLGFNIGSYLSSQGNQRATDSLNARLGIDPNSMVTPFVDASMTQGNNQAQLNYGYAQALAQSQYQQQMDKFNQKQAMYKTIGRFSPIGGALYGGISGGSAGFGSSLSGSADTFSSLLSAGINPMMWGTSGLSGMFGGGGGMNMSTSVNPAAASSSGASRGFSDAMRGWGG